MQRVNSMPIELVEVDVREDLRRDVADRNPLSRSTEGMCTAEYRPDGFEYGAILDAALEESEENGVIDRVVELPHVSLGHPDGPNTSATKALDAPLDLIESEMHTTPLSRGERAVEKCRLEDLLPLFENDLMHDAVPYCGCRDAPRLRIADVELPIGRMSPCPLLQFAAEEHKLLEAPKLELLNT